MSCCTARHKENQVRKYIYCLRHSLVFIQVTSLEAALAVGHY